MKVIRPGQRLILPPGLRSTRGRPSSGGGSLVTPTHGWYLDESSGTRTAAYGSVDLTESAASVGSASGIISNGADFVYADSKNLTASGWTRDSGAATAWSISFWHKMNTTPGATRYSILGDITGNGTCGIENRIASSGRILVAIDGFTTYAWLNSVFTTSLKHFVVVYDGSQADNASRLKVYGNGSTVTLNFVGTIPSSMTLGTGDFLLGAWDVTSTYGDGVTDEVYLYEGTALSSSDVSDLYNSGSGARP